MSFEITELTFKYGTASIINRISIQLPPGKFYGILGPNGSGKTTLLDLMFRHLSPTGGKIVFKDKPLSAYSKKELAKQLALVPQNFYINFPFTAYEIVMMGRYPHIPRLGSPSDQDMEIVEQTMIKTGTIEFHDRMILELSGGERQRVVFARALAQDTPFLLLDEATSNLDIHHTLHLLNLASERVIKENRTVIAVFQDINMAALFCEYLIFMKQGQIIDHGPAKDILTPNILKEVFQVESKVQFDEYANALQVVYKRNNW